MRIVAIDGKPGPGRNIMTAAVRDAFEIDHGQETMAWAAAGSTDGDWYDWYMCRLDHGLRNEAGALVFADNQAAKQLGRIGLAPCDTILLHLQVVRNMPDGSADERPLVPFEPHILTPEDAVRASWGQLGFVELTSELPDVQWPLPIVVPTRNASARVLEQYAHEFVGAAMARAPISSPIAGA